MAESWVSNLLSNRINLLKLGPELTAVENGVWTLNKLNELELILSNYVYLEHNSKVHKKDFWKWCQGKSFLSTFSGFMEIPYKDEKLWDDPFKTWICSMFYILIRKGGFSYSFW